MKTAKQASNTRRSLRNIGNDSKISKGKNTKPPPNKGKISLDEKLREAKTPLKSSPQVSKRKKVADEEQPATPPQSVDSSSEKPNSDTDKSKVEKVVKPKTKRVKKTKDANQQEQDEEWRTLDELGEKVVSSDESKKRTSGSQKGDRRKQSLVERDIPCTVLVQTKPVSVPIVKDGNDSDCEVVDGGVDATKEAGDLQRNAETIEVDIDEVRSETESNFCEIIDEPSTGFDYRRLYIQASRVALPSSLWACHLDPQKEFVSFTRFNPDFPASSGNVVDKAVIFKGSTKPSIYCNGEITDLPEEISSVETLTDVSQVLQHLNSTVLP